MHWNGFDDVEIAETTKKKKKTHVMPKGQHTVSKFQNSYKSIAFNGIMWAKMSADLENFQDFLYLNEMIAWTICHGCGTEKMIQPLLENINQFNSLYRSIDRSIE